MAVFLSNGAVVPTPGGVLGDATPMFNNASYYANSALALESSFAAYGQLYKAQLWIGIVVRKKAMATARMPFQILRQGTGVLKSVQTGALADLMEDPNPEMSGFDLWRWTSSTRDIYGEAFWRKIRDNHGQVRELWPMHPTNVIVRRSKNGALEYVYAPGMRTAEGVEPLPASDVVAFTAYNPETSARGLSNLESLRMTLLNEDASRRATASFWHKGARPSLILTHPDTISAAAQKRLKDRAEANMSGADNAGAISLFEEGITPHIVQLNMEEMQYVESRKLNREEVCAAYDISPLVVHILDHATFSNVTEQLRSQYRDSMAPWFTEMESTVNKQLVPDFYPSTGRIKVKTRFNMDDVLRGDYENRSTATMGLRQGGIATGNEARGIMGLDPSDDPNMDKLFANAALQPLGAKKETPLALAPPVPADEETPAEDPPKPAPKQGMIPNPPKTPNSRRARWAVAQAENQKEQ